MHVVPTGMHHRNFDASIVARGHLAGVGEAGLFFHRERIQLRAQHHRRTGAVLQDSHHTQLADACGHLEPELAQAFYQGGRGALFVE